MMAVINARAMDPLNQERARGKDGSVVNGN